MKKYILGLIEVFIGESKSERIVRIFRLNLYFEIS